MGSEMCIRDRSERDHILFLYFFVYLIILFFHEEVGDDFWDLLVGLSSVLLFLSLGVAFGEGRVANW